jgi:hypothetical protein
MWFSEEKLKGTKNRLEEIGNDVAHFVKSSLICLVNVIHQRSWNGQSKTSSVISNVAFPNSDAQKLSKFFILVFAKLMVEESFRKYVSMNSSNCRFEVGKRNTDLINFIRKNDLLLQKVCFPDAKR